MQTRCDWCGNDPLYIAYHDNEWGVPLHDDRRLFELLTLEGAQAGLSWLTILRKREGYRRAFDHFDIARVAAYAAEDVARLLADPGIVRNRLKIEATVSNARGIMELQREYGTFAAFIWCFVAADRRQNAWRSLAELPPSTAESALMSRELKKRGFNFVGPTICYAFMQATGMVNDHLVSCYRHKELQSQAGQLTAPN